MLTVEKVRLWNITKDGEPCALKGASTVRGGGHAMPTGLTVPTLLLNGGCDMKSSQSLLCLT